MNTRPYFWVSTLSSATSNWYTTPCNQEVPYYADRLEGVAQNLVRFIISKGGSCPTFQVLILKNTDIFLWAFRTSTLLETWYKCIFWLPFAVTYLFLIIFLLKQSWKMKTQVFWDVTQCGIVKKYWSLHELEFLDYPEYRGGNLHPPKRRLLFTNIWNNIPEGSNLHQHSYENVKSRINTLKKNY